MKTFLLLSFLFPSIVMAARGTNELDWRFESFLSFGKHQNNDSTLNPSNAVFQNPSSENLLDARADFKWLINDAKVIARPRWTLTQKTIEVQDMPKKTSTLGKADMTDLFWEQPWTRRWSTTLGLQVFQWGPSEIFNASNPFFRFQKDQQTYTFKEKGHVLARVNYSANQENSWIFISEPVSNNERFYMYEKSFVPQWMLKYEKSKRKSRNYAGLLGGQEHLGNSFIGEYGQWEVRTGHSLVFDFKHSRSHSTYRPELLDSGYINFNLVENLGWSHIGTIGYRYEGDFDFRFEYLYNSLGYSKEEWTLVKTSLTDFTNPLYEQNILRFNSSGLQLNSQNYLYTSVRITNPFSKDGLNIYFRNFYGFMDSSGSFQTESDMGVGDRLTFFGTYTQNYGKLDSEFTLRDRWSFQFGLKL